MAQLPAQDFHQLDVTMAKVATWGEEDLIALAHLLKPMNTGENAVVEYALSGLSAYVGVPGRDDLRKRVALAYAKSLQKSTDKDAQSFILSQLQGIAQDDVVAYVAPFLSDNQLADPASRVLVAVGGDLAKKILREALSDAKQHNLIFIVQALGYLKDSKAVKAIMPYVNNKNENVRKATYFALAAIADPQSKDVFTKIADERNYRFDTSYAFGAYLSYIKNLSKKDQKLAEQLAKELMIKTDSHEIQARIAALTLVVDLQGEKSLPLLETAFNGSNKTYRVAALRMAITYMNSHHVDFWVK